MLPCLVLMGEGTSLKVYSTSVIHRAISNSIWTIWVMLGLLDPMSKLLLCVGFVRAGNVSKVPRWAARLSLHTVLLAVLGS